MPPFRDLPEIELGPLDVGLAKAAANAAAHLPDGGRLIVRQPAERLPPYRTGALGSVGLVLALFAGAALSTSMEPSSFGLGAGVVGAASVSLALVLRAADGMTTRPTYSGVIVGRAARRLLARWLGLARRAERSADTFGPRQLAVLRRSIALARDVRIAPWLPRDVVGRAELLAARAQAQLAGRRWIEDQTQLAAIWLSLRRAEQKLDDPTPARDSLDAIERRAHLAAWPASLARLRPLPVEDDFEPIETADEADGAVLCADSALRS